MANKEKLVYLIINRAEEACDTITKDITFMSSQSKKEKVYS